MVLGPAARPYIKTNRIKQLLSDVQNQNQVSDRSFDVRKKEVDTLLMRSYTSRVN